MTDIDGTILLVAILLGLVIASWPISDHRGGDDDDHWF